MIRRIAVVLMIVAQSALLFWGWSTAYKTSREVARIERSICEDKDNVYATEYRGCAR